jgi:GT2 family glycosyltransferase
MPDAATGLIDAAPPPPCTAPRCAAVVVHYRDAAATLRCIASLRAQPERPRIIVVDNASPDGSGDALAAALAGRRDVELLRALRNGGFGAGCNLGIAHALRQGPDLAHVLLLNPDAGLRAGALSELLATAARHPRAGIVGCRIDDGSGRLWFGHGRIPRWTLSRFHVPPPPADEHPTGFVTGACMLLAADLLRAGLRFDERYFLYAEDADLCARVVAAGRELWITHRARAWHQGGGSQPGERVLDGLTADQLYWLTRGKAIFAGRHLHWGQRCVFWLIAALGKPLAGLLRTRSLAFLGPYWRGLRDGLAAGRAP